MYASGAAWDCVSGGDFLCKIGWECGVKSTWNIGYKLRSVALVENYNKDDMVIIRNPFALKGKDWSLINVYLKKRICLNTSGCVVLASQEEEI